MKVALIAYDPSEYSEDDLDEMTIADFDAGNVKTYDTAQITFAELDGMASWSNSCGEHGMRVYLKRVE